MPPKKKKSTPMVVGTVSTRSTRRESIVNIEIIPKASKSSARTPVSKKTSKKLATMPNKIEIEETKAAGNPDKTRPEILEILRDWSDDENSQDESMLSITSETRSLILNKNISYSSSLNVDQQSLIDILEGNQLESSQSKSIKQTPECQHTQKESLKPNFAKDILIENPVVSVGSPQIEESEIIEECVVEDDSIIIELPEEHGELDMKVCANKELNVSIEDISKVDNKLGSPIFAPRSESSIPESTVCDSNSSEQRLKSPLPDIEISNIACSLNKNKNQYDINMDDRKRRKQKKLSANYLEENSKQSLISGTDEENQSVTSEDTTSQSMITVQDENVSDNNDVQMSDNSTNNYDVIEEQIVFDSCEPIILENMDVQSEVPIEKSQLDSNLTSLCLEKVEESEKVNESGEICFSQELGKSFLNDTEMSLNLPKKSLLQQLSNKDVVSPEAETSEEKGNDLFKKNKGKGCYKDLLIEQNITVQQHNSQDKVSDNSIKCLDQQNPVLLGNVSTEKYNKTSLKKGSIPAKCISKPSTISCSEEKEESVCPLEPTKSEKCPSENNKKHIEELTNFPSKIESSDSESKSTDGNSEENTLCQKINESMRISKETLSLKELDPASEKIQEGIQNMQIEEKGDQLQTILKTTECTSNNKSSVTAGSNDFRDKEDTKNISKEADNEEPQLISEETEGIKSNLEDISKSPSVKKEKSFLELDPEKFPNTSKAKRAVEVNITQRRRSSRRKTVGDEAKSAEIINLEETPKIVHTDKQKDTICVKNVTSKGTSEFQTNLSFELALQNANSVKLLKTKNKKVPKKEDIDKPNTDNVCSVMIITELDSNKDIMCPKDLKGKSKKVSEKHAADVIKMDIDSENSITKILEAEGDSTSNESNQFLNINKIYKTRAKNVSKKHVDGLNKLVVEAKPENSETVSEIKKSELETDTANEDNSNKNPRTSKIKGKKSMDLEISANDSDVKILQDDIDATIDEVLRKYTQDVPDTPEESESLKESKLKVSKPTKESRKKKDNKFRKDEKYESSEEVRRSDRIKTILPVKKKSHGLVRSKSEPALSVEAENSDTSSVHSEIDKPIPVSPLSKKKQKAKSRAKSSENLQVSNSGSLLTENSPQLPKAIDLKTDKSGQAEIEARLKSFIHLKENQYKTDRQICKEAQEMVCDCYLAEEDIQKDEYGCGDDCLNRLLMIECGHLCQIGDRCTNKRFQKGQVAPVEVFKTEKKGLGLIAAANIPYGEFILEYIGEVLNPEEFDKRAEVYSKDKNIHFYFMSLRADAIIDATMKGNISRFINHSCDPNAETQKWTVNGELRIGFFSTRTILAGEEITFDYKFQRYGKEAQKCYCEAATCRGWLGERPDESEDEDEEEEEDEETIKVNLGKVEVKVPSPEILGEPEISEKDLNQEKISEKMDIDMKADVTPEIKLPEETPAIPQVQETPKKVIKKKLRNELLFEDFDQLNEDIDMVVTTGLKNQAHTLKLSRLMVRAKDLEQRKKLLRVLRRGELPCRRLFLDYHGLRLMHGYMIDAQQLTNVDKKLTSSHLDFLQTKLELLQTLAVLPIQNKTMLIESKVLPAVEKWAKNEDLVEDSNDQKDVKTCEEVSKQDNLDSAVTEKIDEIKFLANKLLEEWGNLKESFRIPKKQRIEQMKEHEKEANRKYVESSHAQERESSRKNDQRYRSWSRYKSERETNKKGYRPEDKDRPSAEFLKISKHERRKLFALQMELKEEERRLKQREMWRQHEMNCMMIGADPRFTAPFDPSKGFQYIWNPSIGQWQALPVPSAQNQSVFNSPATPQGGVTGYNVPPTSQGVSSFNTPPTHKQNLLGSYQSSMLNVPGLPGPAQQYPGIQPNIAPMVPGLATSVSSITNTVGGIQASLPGLTGSLPGLPGLTGLLPGMTGQVHGISGGSVPGITQPPLPALPMYQEVKQPEEDLSQVKFAGPIPPPVKLPPKWKCAKDKYGRPYYYHIKIRKSQWEPPPLPEEVDESSESSSSETSTLSSSDSSSDSDTEDDIDDTKLLMEVRKQMENTAKITLKSVIPSHVKNEEKDSATSSPEIKNESDNEEEGTEEIKKEIEEGNSEKLSSIDIRLKEQFNLDSNDPPKKKRRLGLCQEIIISPRTEEDRQQFKEDLKRYKATKEKLKRQKEQMAHQAKKKLKAGSSTNETKKIRDKRFPKSTAKSRIKQINEWNDEHAKKIKEVFRSTMATTVVGVLNAYRKPDCKESRITNTEDFKHLARKLTHFVMLKEIKHINTIDELICTDNVKAKAREYIKKYMSKFGEVYQKRQDEPDFKD